MKNIVKVKIMKKISQKVAKSVISIAKRNTKDDINSTGSPWLFQPKIPQSADKYKKTSK